MHGYVVELTPFEMSAELLDEETVGGHVRVLGVPASRNLLDHQVRVAETQDSLDAQLLGRL